jgi:hypothetical protein
MTRGTGTMPQTDDFYGGAIGAPSMSWNDKHNPGCFINMWRGGLVLSVRKKQATDANDSKPKFWPDGNGGFTDRPIQTLVITVLTEERDASNPVDDGARTIYVDQENTKYSKRNKQFPGMDKPGTQYGAHCDAMVAAGRPRTLPEPGGYYYMCQTGTAKGSGDIPRKLWATNYRVPTPEGLAALDQYIAAAGKGDEFADNGNGQQAQGPFVNSGQPQQAPPPPPQPGQPAANQAPSQQSYTAPPPPPAPEQNGQQAPRWNPPQQPAAQQGASQAQYQQQPQQAPPPPPAPPVQNGVPQQQYAQQPPTAPVGAQPVFLGYDAQGQPVYGQPAPTQNGVPQQQYQQVPTAPPAPPQPPQQAYVDPNQQQYAYQGPPPQQPAAAGSNPYAQ